MAWLDALRSTPGLSDADVNRYGTKPLLIFVEAYVLDSIGQLGPDKLALAKKMASRAFGASPDWKLAIRNVLGLEESFDDEVREIWQQNLEQFHNQGLRADPIAFARAFADENFAKSP